MKTKLFCDKKEILKLKKEVRYTVENQVIKYESGTLFKVENIIGLGFDLSPINHRFNNWIRLLNSELPDYFDYLNKTSS